MAVFRKHRRKWLEGCAVAGIALLTFLALHALLRDVHLHDITHAARELNGWRIAAALALTAVSYLILTLYDVLALRIIGKPLPYRTAALASLTSYTLSHNLGFALLTGGSARYRIYTAAGLDPADVLRIIATASATFWSGVVAMAGVALIMHPGVLQLGPVVLGPDSQRVIGGAMISFLAAGMAWVCVHRMQISLLGWKVFAPSPAQALLQPLLAAFDLIAASAALFVLVPDASAAQFPAFFLSYALAMVAALLTHVPGGIGVFETVMVAMMPGNVHAALLAALILYRALYYLLPLLVASLLLAIHERRQLRLSRFACFTGATWSALTLVMRSIAPAFLTAMVFLGGAILLVSGALPAVPGRLHLLRDLAPLPFVEASHIAASLVGTGLLLMAPALYRRLDAGFLLTRALLVTGALFSLAKGLDYEEAITLLVMAAVLQIARPAFYRRTALTSAFGSRGALGTAAICVGLAIWVGFFAYRHVDYQSQLWWEFAWKGDASRFLRTTFAIAVALICVGVIRLMGHAGAGPQLNDVDIAASDAAILQSSRTDAFLAYTGDKRFLRSASGDAMLMYQIQGRSWIVMGDPVGSKTEWPNLLWQIREMADVAQGRLLLYQIGVEAMPYAVDLGLQLVKYGEEARVPLADFTLEGPDMKGLRHAERRALREGMQFEIIPAAEVPRLLPELRQVSDAWLKGKGKSEKAFSIGHFDPAYLSRFACAAVRHEGPIVAFANIWATANHEEISVDLMRHGYAVPYGAMDFLFVQLMRWGRAQGYRWFNLGLAPLSGIEARRLAPVWAQLGGLLYRHGDAFYSFEGLRAYKDKFDPVWEPRYLGAPHGVGLVRSLIDLQMLVGGGKASAASPRKLALVA